MKRFAFLLGAFIILFASCSSQFSESKTSVNIQLPSARAIDDPFADETVYDVTVSLSINGVEQTQKETGTISSLAGHTFTFSNIEIGARAVASCEISKDKVVVWQGKSEEVAITEGVKIAINMKKVEENEKPDEPDEPIEITGITLNKTKLSIYIDQEETLTATIEPENATAKLLDWSISDNSIAKIEKTENGAKIIPLAEGKATITVKAANEINATCEITVSTTFTQERFRELMPNYAENTDKEFSIPKGYTKITGVNNSVNADLIMESVFAGWAVISKDSDPTTGQNEPIIIIPASVVYIDEAAFYQCFATYQLTETKGWMYYNLEDESKNHYVGYEHWFIRENMTNGSGYMKKVSALDVQFPGEGLFFRITSIPNVEEWDSNTYKQKPIEKGTAITFTASIEQHHEDVAGIEPSTTPDTSNYSYSWYVDGVLQSKEKNSIFIWKTENVSSGVHEIMCVVDGKFSTTVKPIIAVGVETN